MVAFGGEGCAQLVNMVSIASLKLDAYGAAVNLGGGVDALMRYANHVAAFARYHVAHAGELSGLVE